MLLFATSSAFSQQPTDSFSFLGNSFDNHWKTGSFIVRGDAFVGSNAINTAMYTDVLFRSSFTPEAKQKFLDGNQVNTNLLAERSGYFEYKISSDKGVYAKYNNINAFKSNKEFSEMLFFGNAAFEDETVSSKNTRFTQATSFSGGVTFKSTKGTKWNLKTAVGVNVLSDYRALNADNLSLYTSTGGAYLDAELQNLSVTENNEDFMGIGLDFNQKIVFTPNDTNSFTFELNNLNFNYLINQTAIYIDTTLRFNGIEYDFINDSSSIAEFFDSSYNSVVNRGRDKKRFTILPTTITLAWNRKLSEKSTLTAQLTAVDFGLYGITTTVGLNHSFSDRLRVHSKLGYGTFTGVVWEESVEYRTKGGYSIFGRLVGINAVALPNASKNYGAGIGLAKQF